MRTGGTVFLGLLLITSIVPVAAAGPQPGLFCDEGEMALGRLFPEPDEVTDFIGFEDAECGLERLNERYPDLVEVKVIAESVGWTNLMSQEKDRFPVYAVELTDETVAEKRGSIVMITSVHGNEKGAREAMLRVIEDLLIGEGVGAQVEEATGGVGIDQVLDDLRLVFVFPNPDGWTHEQLEYRQNDACYVSATCGTASEPGEVGVESQWFVRVNGNGTDLNRQYPTTGVPHPTIPPLSEPEGQGTHAYLQSLPEPVLAGADLHGMLDADNLMFLLQKDTQRDLEEFLQDEAVAMASEEWIRQDETAMTWEDSQARGDTVVWGPTIDLLGYSAPGTGGAYIVQDTGLDAAGFTVEMAFSHITFDNYYEGAGRAMNVLHVAGLRAMFLGFLDYAYHLPEAATVHGDSAVGVLPHSNVLPEARYDGTDADPLAFFDELAEGGADVQRLDGVSPGQWEDLTHLVIPSADLASLEAAYHQALQESIGDDDPQVDAIPLVDVLRAWTEAGGTLVLTDASVELAVDLGLAEDVTVEEDFTGRVHTADMDHALTAGLPIELRTLYDGNPLGFEAGTVPSHCLLGWEGDAVGERILGQPTVAGVLPDPNAEGERCTVVGEASLGDGTVRVLGAALPGPAAEGPNGADGYSLTPNGARVFLNALDLGFEPSEGTSGDGSGLDADEGDTADAPVPMLLPLLALGLAGAVLRRRW